MLQCEKSVLRYSEISHHHFCLLSDFVLQCLLLLKDVCKTYKYGKEETKALNNINLTIKDGEFVAVIGNSGSGK